MSAQQKCGSTKSITVGEICPSLLGPDKVQMFDCQFHAVVTGGSFALLLQRDQLPGSVTHQLKPCHVHRRPVESQLVSSCLDFVGSWVLGVNGGNGGMKSPDGVPWGRGHRQLGTAALTTSYRRQWGCQLDLLQDG